MTKLHELLAVESDAKGTFHTAGLNAIEVFDQPHLFQGYVKRLEMFDEDQSHLNQKEHREISTTVHENLTFLSDVVVKYFDIVLQKETTNQNAVADLVIDGKTIAKDVPATFLLGLESKLGTIKKIYEKIPVLDVAVKWDKAPELGAGIYVQHYPETSIKTKKMFQHQILIGPTEYHPAQIEKWEEQLPAGKFTKENWRSMLPVQEKTKLLKRIDLLIEEVRKARQRANCAEVAKVNIGKKLMDFIHAD